MREITRKLSTRIGRRITKLESVDQRKPTLIKGSYIEVYPGIEFPKHDFQFNYDTNCRIYVVILHHSGLLYNMF